MISALKASDFPNLRSTVRAHWAPVYLSPLLGSPERFVIAVAVANDADFHIEHANELRRLTCLYGRSSETALFAAEVAIDELKQILSEKGVAGLVEGTLVFSGVSIGEVTVGEATSLQQLARTWMSALSSLYQFRSDTAETGDVVSRDTIGADRLPILILDHVNAVNPSLTEYFSEEIRTFRRRRTSSGIAGVSIDFNGSRLVANFATLAPSAPAHVVDRIKRKMFDLKVRRDREGQGLFPAREHEMILFSPASDNPLASEQQLERVDDVLGSLKEQSLHEGFGFSAMHEVAAIGTKVLVAETQIGSA